MSFARRPAVKAKSQPARAAREAHPSRPRAVARCRRHQAGSGGVLRGDLAVDLAACRRPSAGAGALPRRRGGGCFFQKHAWAGIGEHVMRAQGSRRTARRLLAIKDVEGLLSLVQASVLEVHVWGAKLDNIEKPDGITFDLDPDAAVAVAGCGRRRLRGARPPRRSSGSTASSRRRAARACTSTRRSSRMPIGPQ